MKKLLVFALVLLVSSMFTGLFVFSAPVGAQSTYLIQGYVKDASGTPVANAAITFNNPSVQYTQTNSQGYYAVNAPAGTYRIDVFPPYNSHFINSYEQNYLVSGTATKNFTLYSGYKVSGYVANSAGTPMVGASVLFKIGSVVYGSGYFTDTEGYYYVVVQPGTYTIDAHPQTAYDPNYQGQCTPFPTYTETGYTVNGDVNRNIIVANTSPTPTSTPTVTIYTISGYILDQNGHGIAGTNIIFNVPETVPSVYSDSTGHYQILAPAGTYHINVWPPFDSSYINYDETSFTVSADASKNMTLTTGYKVSGYIKDTSGTPMVGAVVFLNNYGSGWFTNYSGFYFLAVPAGTYTLNAHPRIGTYVGPTSSFQTYTENSFAVNANTAKNITVNPQANPTPTPAPTAHPTAQPTTNPTTPPTTNPTPTPTPQPPTNTTISAGENVFFIQSNSTITNLSFNSTSQQLSFIASGTTGTQGFTTVTIAKTLVSDVSSLTVNLDNTKIPYIVTSQGNNWILTFNYSHSTHHVTIDLAAQATAASAAPVASIDITLIIGAFAATIAVLTSGLLLYKRAHKKQLSSTLL